MKKNHLICLLSLMLSFLLQVKGMASEKIIPGNDDPNVIIDEWGQETKRIHDLFDVTLYRYTHEVNEINIRLKTEKSLEKKVDLLIRKDELQDSIRYVKLEEINQISRIRYIKGLQIIRLLYEKILSLDHHFTSVRTFSEINKISNPNHFPEYAKVKDIIKNKKNKKLNMDLDGILGSNMITSVTGTLINLFDIDLVSQNKREELRNIECIIDFTLSIHNELNTIYFETSYLQSGNANIKSEIENLFRDYTKPIGYTEGLTVCRENDDWDAVRSKLDSFLQTMSEIQDEREKFKKNADVEFPVDRLLQFITLYNNYINEGEQFYRKFKTILNSYQNEEQCKSSIPIEYTKMKEDVEQSIQKFNIAYKPIEVNGSKMKEIIYGLNEFE